MWISKQIIPTKKREGTTLTTEESVFHRMFGKFSYSGLVKHADWAVYNQEKKMSTNFQAEERNISRCTRITKRLKDVGEHDMNVGEINSTRAKIARYVT